MKLRTHSTVVRLMAVLAIVGLLSSCGRKKYDNPITKDTKQPDKVLFDQAIKDIERNRFSVARITLQTLMNTYDTSEFMAKAKLAYADSWFREGGSSGLAQAEAEYKDFILFYPTLPEAAEAQEKVCNIHYNQMEKADRDPSHAQRAEDECRQLLIQFPNSHNAPQVRQKLRNIQEVLAQHEMGPGKFYHGRGAFPAAANRLQGLVNHYPLYSGADEALWKLGDSYGKMGPRFRDKAGESYAKIVREYPFSPYVDEAKKKLKDLEMPIPEVDPVAYNRQKYDLENKQGRSMAGKALGFMSKAPDTSKASRSGEPALTNPERLIPVSVPAAVAGTGTGTGGFQGDVSVTPVTDPNALDKNPEARPGTPSQTTDANGQAGTSSQTGTSSQAGTGGQTGANGQTTAPAATEGTGQPAAPAATEEKQDKKGKKKSKKDDKRDKASK